jgi:microcystin-dependent protein
MPAAVSRTSIRSLSSHSLFASPFKAFSHPKTDPFMAQPYVGEIRMFAGNFAPAGWMFCNGDLISISENETLFQLVGTTYGGDGESTFALPDMRGRLPIHQGGGFVLAETGGAEEITLTPNQIPAHTHALVASASAGSLNSPSGAVFSEPSVLNPYIEDVTAVSLSPQAMTSVGGSQPHSNLQPYLCVSFIISLFGIFPSPS